MRAASKVRIRVDDYFLDETWWIAARLALPHAPESARCVVEALGQCGEALVTPRVARVFHVWARQQAGWAAGPRWAKHPVVIEPAGQKEGTT